MDSDLTFEDIEEERKKLLRKKATEKTIKELVSLMHTREQLYNNTLFAFEAKIIGYIKRKFNAKLSTKKNLQHIAEMIVYILTKPAIMCFYIEDLFEFLFFGDTFYWVDNEKAIPAIIKEAKAFALFPLMKINEKGTLDDIHACEKKLLRLFPENQVKLIIPQAIIIPEQKERITYELFITAKRK